MDSKRAGGIAIFGVIVLMLIWAMLNLLPNTASAPISNGDGSNTASPTEAGGPEVVVTRTVEGDVYTYSGAIPVPTPCHMLTSSASVAYTATTEVLVALTIKKPGAGEICAQVITPQEFTAAVTSKSNPEFKLTLDGKPARVTIKE